MTLICPREVAPVDGNAAARQSCPSIRFENPPSKYPLETPASWKTFAVI